VRILKKQYLSRGNEREQTKPILTYLKVFKIHKEKEREGERDKGRKKEREG
jgi:hypothetical protein